MESFTLSQAFDGQNISAISLDRKHGAGLHCRIVDHHRARAANTGLAADVSAGEAKDVTKKMDEE